MSVAQVGPIHIVPYNSEWPHLFEMERRVIETALGEDVFLVEHVGSTSVPGLVAKPRIDIVAVAGDRYRSIQALEKVGYTYQGEWNMPLKAAFTKREETEVNLHLFFELSHPEVELNLRFRDYLREHIDTREAYAQLKEDLLKDPTSQHIPNEFPLYTLRKGPFIESVLRQMGYNRLRVLKANTEEQWSKVAEFRAKAEVKTDPLREQHEHFVLYRGVDMIGYADIALEALAAADVFEVEDPVDSIEAAAFFKDIISQWIRLRISHSLEVNKLP